jgi:hypothetical protein
VFIIIIIIIDSRHVPIVILKTAPPNTQTKSTLAHSLSTFRFNNNNNNNNTKKIFAYRKQEQI